MNKCIHNPVCKYKVELNISDETECNVTIVCKDFAEHFASMDGTLVDNIKKPAKLHPWRRYPDKKNDKAKIVKTKKKYKPRKTRGTARFNISDPNDIKGILGAYQELDRLRRNKDSRLTDNQVLALGHYKGKIMKKLSESERQQILTMYKEVKSNG